MGFVYGGQEKQTVGDKLSGLLFRPAYPCPSRTNNFNLIPFQSWKKVFFFFFFRNAQLTPACFLSSERRCCGGCIKELDISLSSSSSGTGYNSAVADLLSKLHVYQKKKKNFLKPGQKSWHFRERFFSKGGRRKMWRIMNSSS